MIFAPIVEGDGEVEALPVLIRRIASNIAPAMSVEVLRPHRVKRQRIVKPGELERVVDFAGRKIGAADAILVLLDADDDCPAALGPDLLARARRARSDRSIAVVLAKRTFEAWLIGGIESLRGIRSVLEDATCSVDPESLAGPKAWLAERMATGYSETVDQAALAANVDLGLAARAASFRKLQRDLERLLQAPAGPERRVGG